MDNSFMRYESVDILDLKELLMPRVVSECIPDKHFGNELMVPVPFMEDYFENKEYYENDFFFELPDSVVLNGSQFMGIGVAPYNFILLMKWPDKDCLSGYHFRARGFYTYAELSCYIDRCAPVSFVYWIYVKDIDSYTEVQYHIIRSHDGNFERAVIPCLAEFPKQELDLSGTDLKKEERREFREYKFKEDYHTGLFHDLDEVKQYIEETKLMSLMSLKKPCRMEGHFIYDEKRYDYIIFAIPGHKGKVVYKS